METQGWWALESLNAWHQWQALKKKDEEEEMAGQELINAVTEIFDGKLLIEVELPCIQCGTEGGDNFGLCEDCWVDAQVEEYYNKLFNRN